MNESISGEFSFPANFVEVNGAKIHYVEAGEGDAILFLHGIPTSAYIWRNIIPHLTSLGRCIALDLIGFGRSDKPHIDYSLEDHILYLEKFIQALNLKNITFIMHGFGSVLGFDYAMRHENQCKGLVFYEGFLRPLSEEDLSLPFQEQLITLINQEDIYTRIMNGSDFIDQVIPPTTMRNLTIEELNCYKQPFQQKDAGKPFLRYLQELSSHEGREKLDKLITQYSNKLTESYLPKLMLYSVPGFITTIANIMWAKEFLPNLEIADIGEELHFAQESYPQLIGETISVWLQSVDQMRGN